MNTRSTVILLALLGTGGIQAQSNKGGSIHLCIGTSLGFHTTHYESSYTVPGLGIAVNYSDDGDAATVSYPIEVHFGLAEIISLGLYVEPGFYLDSSDTQSNMTVSVGIAPRVYIVNKDKFNWYGGLDLGYTGLEIKENEGTAGEYKDSYAGGHFRLTTGVSFYITQRFGLQANLKYGSYNMKWRDREPNPDVDGFSAELKTQAFHIGAGLTFRFGD